MTKLGTFFGTLLGKIVAVVLVILLTLGTVSYCSGNRQAVEQGKQDSRTATAVLDAVDTATETAAANADEDDDFRDVVDDAVAIAKEQTDEKVSRTAVVTGLCRLPNYRGDPACSVRASDSETTD